MASLLRFEGILSKMSSKCESFLLKAWSSNLNFLFSTSFIFFFQNVGIQHKKAKHFIHSLDSITQKAINAPLRLDICKGDCDCEPNPLNILVSYIEVREESFVDSWKVVNGQFFREQVVFGVASL